MAKLARVLQKLFGSTGSTNEFGIFGSDSEGSAQTTKDLASIQSLSTFLRGLYGSTANATQPPRIQDMNALYYLFNTQIKYLFQSGIPEWISTENYYANSSVVLGSNGNIYKSLTGSDSTPNIGNNPISDATNWALVWDKTNDGSGSGLDADLLDGRNSDLYVRTGSDLGGGGDLNSFVTAGMWRLGESSTYTNFPSGANSYGNLLVIRGASDTLTQIYFNYINCVIWIRSGSGTGSSWTSWKNIWTTDNDGSGSGLDADLLDGCHAGLSGGLQAQYAKQLTGYPDNTDVDIIPYQGYFGPAMRIRPSGDTSNRYIDFGYWDNTGTFHSGFMIKSNGLVSDVSFLGNQVWNAGNDGTGSGLDADTVDGYHAGHSSGQIPVSDGTVNTNLNAALWGGISVSVGSAGTYGYQAISSESSWIIPSGLYMITCLNGVLQIYNGGIWVGGGEVGGLVLSDGINYKIYATANTVAHYRKLA